MSVNYNSAFSFSPKTFPIILDLAETNKYSLRGLAEHAAKLSSADISAIENTLAMLSETGILFLKKNKCVLAHTSINKINNLITAKLKNDEILEEVASHLKKDSEGDRRWINPISLYEGFNGVLAMLRFLNIVDFDSKQKKYFLTEKGLNLFEKNIGMTPEQLKEVQKAQEERGEIAERHILECEQIRLKNHPMAEQIKRVSEINVSEGYDIQSFQSMESNEIDKFIEVKSFLESERFFWSINEIKVAARKKENYSLYIVNFSKLDDKKYTYKEINNPYEYFKMQDHVEENIEIKFNIQPQNFLISLKN